MPGRQLVGSVHGDWGRGELGHMGDLRPLVAGRLTGGLIPLFSCASPGSFLGLQSPIFHPIAINFEEIPSDRKFDGRIAGSFLAGNLQDYIAGLYCDPIWRDYVAGP